MWCAGRNTCGRPVICGAALSKRRTGSETSRLQRTRATISTRAFSSPANRCRRCKAKPVQGEAEQGLAFVKNARFGLVVDAITTQLALIRMLRGLTPKFGCFDDGQFNEVRIEHHLSSTPALAMVACWYWIRKLQARYIAGD